MSKVWTEEEESALLSCHKKKTKAQALALVNEVGGNNRSVGSIKSKATLMGVSLLREKK